MLNSPIMQYHTYWKQLELGTPHYKSWFPINIPREIGSNYSQFGILLLNDHNGTKVSNIEDKHRGDAVQNNTEILREWVTGRGKHPVSWETLTEVLHNIGLGILASEIEVVKLKQTMSTVL